MNCRKCNTTLTGNFCSHCGRPEQIARVDWHYIVHEIQHVLHFEKGIPLTVKELILRPGPSIREFIKVDRTRLVKPVLFLVVTSLIYTTIEHFFHIEEGYIDATNAPRSVIGDWMQNHYGHANIIMCVFIALWLKLVYRKYDYNYFEILILLCFVMGIGMLIFSVFSLFEGLTGLHVMKISAVLGIAYCTWAIGHFFESKRVMSYVKALIAYLAGMVTAVICGMVLELGVYIATH